MSDGGCSGIWPAMCNRESTCALGQAVQQTHCHSLRVGTDVGWRPIAEALHMERRTTANRGSLRLVIEADDLNSYLLPVGQRYRNCGTRRRRGSKVLDVGGVGRREQIHRCQKKGDMSRVERQRQSFFFQSS